MRRASTLAAEGKDVPDPELVEKLEAELRRLQVGDVLLHTFTTLSSLGYLRLSPSDRDLGQARLAIDALRALTPLLERAVPPELARDLNSAVANMQLAYAKTAPEEKATTAEDPPSDGIDAAAGESEPAEGASDAQPPADSGT